MAEHGAVYSRGQVMQLSAGGSSCGILQHHHCYGCCVGRSVGQGAALRTKLFKEGCEQALQGDAERCCCWPCKDAPKGLWGLVLHGAVSPDPAPPT